ncbi:hypothetical protein CLAIMM_12901 isoform 3 [Cladophialophora immunda]|nr:hypothetical protein CLAIMM_12901 isoform 3 [Cladophialophora immunda]
MRTSNIPWTWALLPLLSWDSFVAPARASPSVNVALQASFSAGPYLVELLETAALENSSSYFPLLDRIADGAFADLQTEQELYTRFLNILQEDGHLSTPESLSSFKFALALHAAAPRVEAHFQYYTTSIQPHLMAAQDAACPVWVYLDGEQYCSPALDRAQQPVSIPDTVNDLPFDRVLGASSDGLPSILYADITHPLFGQFHSVVSQTAREGRSTYKVRYRPSASASHNPIHVTGYGVELVLKRTDYIVIDDRDAQKPEDATPDQQSLETVKDDELKDLRPLTTSEVANLGVNAASFILSSSNPLDTLLQVTSDFPKYSSLLAAANASREFILEHRANREQFLPSGYNVLWINGVQIEPRQINAYSLLDHLRRERRIIAELKNLGLTSSEAISLLSSEIIAEAQANETPQRFDWRDDSEAGGVLMWLNDLEQDRRYAGWSSSLRSLFQRTYPGQLPQVSRDIHNLIVPLDMGNIKDIELAATSLQSLVRRQVPIRIALIPTGDGETANTYSKVAYYISDTYGLTALMSFFSDVVASKKLDASPEKSFNTAIKGRATRPEKEPLSFQDVLTDESLHLRLQARDEYLKRLALAGPNPPFLVNGVVLPRTDNWFELLSARFDRAHLLIVIDLESETGRALLLEAMLFHQRNAETELLIIHNPSPETQSSTFAPGLYALLQEGGRDLTVERLEELLKGDLNSFTDDLTDASAEFWRSQADLIRTLSLAEGQNGLWLNGRLLGPLEQRFTSVDFESLLEFERRERIAPVTTAITGLALEDRFTGALDLAKITSLVARSLKSDLPEGLRESAPLIRLERFKIWNGTHTSIKISNSDDINIQIVAAIDPASELVQQWVPILQTLSQLSGVSVQIFLNPKDRLTELPVKRFFRQVISAEPSFDAHGSLVIPNASFSGIPRDTLFNLGMIVPPSWLVAPKQSIHDLDNIKLSNVAEGENIDAIYELEHILIEGHARDVTNGPPPRGVQLMLGTEDEPHFTDTIVMANLGYFQFKTNPGYWQISLKPGRSSKIFHIDSVGPHGYSAQPGDETTSVALLSFQGLTLFPRLSRKPGMEDEDVLESSALGGAMDYLSRGASFASSALSSLGFKKTSTNADINIFSVASGHLYERMLNIMMVSVMKHTKHSVKFWFIEQFLSPSFKSTLPVLANHYGFDYEMVTYKWPHWLRGQKEKQREIWGYKILFLDVLFPLDLDKVIFVDADQIVRTDMMELNRVDLKGAPYGFTPMCDSRTEMEGFRFWKQGYWETYLRGKPYHISALYVVDLKRFRQLAAGDRLRQQYQALSADPASLSNLDQDLPNHMQHTLPIHSLSQEWLWCETWCDDASLAKAKTIDLCNNPLTKEPKLERARRQVPEWTLYDEEIAGVIGAAKKKQGSTVADNGDLGEAAGDESQRKLVNDDRIRDEL